MAIGITRNPFVPPRRGTIFSWVFAVRTAAGRGPWTLWPIPTRTIAAVMRVGPRALSSKLDQSCEPARKRDSHFLQAYDTIHNVIKIKDMTNKQITLKLCLISHQASLSLVSFWVLDNVRTEVLDIVHLHFFHHQTKHGSMICTCSLAVVLKQLLLCLQVSFSLCCCDALAFSNSCVFPRQSPGAHGACHMVYSF